LSGLDNTTRLFLCLFAYKVLWVPVTVGPYHPQDGHQKVLEAGGTKQQCLHIQLGCVVGICFSVFLGNYLGVSPGTSSSSCVVEITKFSQRRPWDSLKTRAIFFRLRLYAGKQPPFPWVVGLWGVEVYLYVWSKRLPFQVGLTTHVN
jgi:hypothetical protein